MATGTGQPLDLRRLEESLRGMMSDLKSKLQDPISKQGKALEDKKDMIGTHMKME